VDMGCSCGPLALNGRTDADVVEAEAAVAGSAAAPQRRLSAVAATNTVRRT